MGWPERDDRFSVISSRWIGDRPKKGAAPEEWARSIAARRSGRAEQAPPLQRVRRLRALLDFGNLHGLVDGEGGVADGGVGGGGGMTGGRAEITGGAALHGVGVAVALGLTHGERVRRDEFVDGGAVVAEGLEAAFGLRDLQEVAAHAREANRLRRSRARVGRG